MQISQGSKLNQAREAAEAPSRASEAAREMSQSGTQVRPQNLAGSTSQAPITTVGTQENPQFGEVFKKIQAEYGAKPEKAREIKKTLGKDDFMKIMVTQMKNQDPTNPFKAEQMASQMAQYASVEQLQNMNSQMGKMSNQNQPLEKLAMTNLIGKTVTVDKDRVVHTENTKTPISFDLPKAASAAQITIFNEAGEAVFTKEIGAQAQGTNTFGWDGNKANTLPAKSGMYSYRVTAQDANGAEIALKTQGQAQVVGVSFQGKEPVLLVGDPARPTQIPMTNVVRIDGLAEAPAPQAMAPMAQSGIAQSVMSAMNPAQRSAKSEEPALRPQASPLSRESAISNGAASAISEAMSGRVAPQQIQAQSPVGAPTPASLGAGKQNFFTFKKGEGSKNLSPDEMTPAMLQAAQKYAQKAGAQGAAEGSPNLGFAAMDGEGSGI